MAKKSKSTAAADADAVPRRTAPVTGTATSQRDALAPEPAPPTSWLFLGIRPLVLLLFIALVIYDIFIRDANTHANRAICVSNAFSNAKIENITHVFHFVSDLRADCFSETFATSKRNKKQHHHIERFVKHMLPASIADSILGISRKSLAKMTGGASDLFFECLPMRGNFQMPFMLYTVTLPMVLMVEVIISIEWNGMLYASKQRKRVDTERALPKPILVVLRQLPFLLLETAVLTFVFAYAQLHLVISSATSSLATYLDVFTVSSIKFYDWSRPIFVREQLFEIVLTLLCIVRIGVPVWMRVAKVQSALTSTRIVISPLIVFYLFQIGVILTALGEMVELGSSAAMVAVWAGTIWAMTHAVRSTLPPDISEKTMYDKIM